MLRQCCVNNVEHLTIRDTIGIKLYPSCMFGFFYSIPIASVIVCV